MTTASFLPSVVPEDDPQTRSARTTISVIAGTLFVAAIVYGGYRSWLGPAQVIDTVATLREGSRHEWKLAPGVYEISLEGNGTLDMSLPGSNCTSSRSHQAHSQTCELKLAATLAIASPPSSRGGAVTYSLQAQRLAH